MAAAGITTTPIAGILITSLDSPSTTNISISFAPLPDVDRKTRKYKKPLGVAARSGILIQQRQNRAYQHSNSSQEFVAQDEQVVEDSISNPELYSPPSVPVRLDKKKQKQSRRDSTDSIQDSKENSLRFWKRISRKPVSRASIEEERLSNLEYPDAISNDEFQEQLISIPTETLLPHLALSVVSDRQRSSSEPSTADSSSPSTPEFPAHPPIPDLRDSPDDSIDIVAIDPIDPKVIMRTSHALDRFIDDGPFQRAPVDVAMTDKSVSLNV